MREFIDIVETLVLRIGRRNDPDSPASKFMAEYEAATMTDERIPPDTRLLSFGRDDLVKLILHKDISDPNTTIYFQAIETTKRGVGSGSKALKWLCDLADKHGVTLRGTARSYNRQNDMVQDYTALGHKNLVAWYTRHGFQAKRGNARDGQDIVRRPKA